MKAIRTSHSIRPLSGRSLVCASYGGAAKVRMLSTYPSNLLDQLTNSMQALQANLWSANCQDSQACEDQMPPGGGSA